MSADEAAIAAEIAATEKAAEEAAAAEKAADDSTAADNQDDNQDSPLGMSDDEFLKLSAEGFEDIPDKSDKDDKDDKDDDPDNKDNKDDNPDPDDKDDSDPDLTDTEKEAAKKKAEKKIVDDESDSNDKSDPDPNNKDDDPDKDDKDDDPDKNDKDDNPDKDDDKDDKGDLDDSDKDDKNDNRSDDEKEAERIVNASIQLDELFEPFKANGKEMKVDNVEDARVLMQMGANYNKKMVALKPNLKILKMLENNDLLNEEKLSFLIDLDKKDPGAIKKLLKDSKIDTEELDMEAENDYKPSTYTVNDKEVELDDTLNDIRDTDSYAKTLNIISNKWDESSKAALLENPAGIKILNEHVALGYYEKITSAVETERMFGRIPQGMSDLEAYKFVGEAINAQGGFKPKSKSESKTVVGKVVKKVDPKVNEKKRAARSTKGKSPSKAKVDFSPLAMSDEDFEKTGLEKFI